MEVQLSRIEGALTDKLPYRIKNLCGKRFGRLIAISFSERVNKNTFWLCQCDCGLTKMVSTRYLISGRTKSCGCLLIENRISHTFSSHPLYHTYLAMIKRCYNDKHISYKYYGFKGIKVCEDWLNNISAFIHWAMNNGYQKGLTLDRKSNQKEYSPDNCRWVSRKTQNQNKSNNIIIDRNGKKMVLSAWCDELNIRYDTVLHRIYAGWEIDMALNTPIRKKRKNGTITA